jgi:predicted amidohydrolase
MCYNSVAMVDADGRDLGTYRKSHIPTGQSVRVSLWINLLRRKTTQSADQSKVRQLHETAELLLSSRHMQQGLFLEHVN